jgi:hypothetical protein
MVSSYPVTCPHDDCHWAGSLIPSQIRGGRGTEIAPRQPAWFRCPRCGRDWEAQITNDRVTMLSAVEHGG